MTDDQLEFQARRLRSDPPSVPDNLAKKYLRVGDDLFRSSDDKKPIASLKADKITTRTADALRDVMLIAKANGWTAVKIQGSADYKKQAYLEASLQGLSVEGYRPSKLLQAEAERNRNRLAENLQRRSKQPASTPALSEEPQARVLSDRFIRQSHYENAKDKDLRKAQEIVAVAIATARGQFPGDLKAQEKFVAGKKAFIAEALANGDQISGVKLIPRLHNKSTPSPVMERAERSRGR